MMRRANWRCAAIVSILCAGTAALPSTAQNTALPYEGFRSYSNTGHGNYNASMGGTRSYNSFNSGFSSFSQPTHSSYSTQRSTQAAQRLGRNLNSMWSKAAPAVMAMAAESGYQNQGGYPFQQQGGYQNQGGYPVQQQGGYQNQGGYPVQQQGGYQNQGSYPVQQQGGYQNQGGYPVQQQGGYQNQQRAPQGLDQPSRFMGGMMPSISKREMLRVFLEGGSPQPSGGGYAAAPNGASSTATHTAYTNYQTAVNEERKARYAAERARNSNTDQWHRKDSANTAYYAANNANYAAQRAESAAYNGDSQARNYASMARACANRARGNANQARYNADTMK